MNIKNILLTVVIAGVVSVISASVIRSEKVVQEVKEKTSLGALSSPDIASPYLSFGNVRRYAAKKETLGTSTTTPCSLQSPAATSTLISAGIRFEVGSTTKFTVGIAKATDQYSTTTLIGTSYEVAANKQATIVASSTPLGNTLFSPNDWLVFKMGGGSGGNFSPTGVCQATWEVI